MNTQEDLFIEWGYTCSELKELRKCIQNDFKRLKSDNYITNEQIYQDKVEFLKRYDKLMKKLKTLKKSIITVMDTELNS